MERLTICPVCESDSFVVESSCPVFGKFYGWDEHGYPVVVYPTTINPNELMFDDWLVCCDDCGEEIARY